MQILKNLFKKRDDASLSHLVKHDHGIMLTFCPYNQGHLSVRCQVEEPANTMTTNPTQALWGGRHKTLSVKPNQRSILLPTNKAA